MLACGMEQERQARLEEKAIAQLMERKRKAAETFRRVERPSSMLGNSYLTFIPVKLQHTVWRSYHTDPKP